MRVSDLLRSWHSSCTSATPVTRTPRRRAKYHLAPTAKAKHRRPLPTVESKVRPRGPLLQPHATVAKPWQECRVLARRHCARRPYQSPAHSRTIGATNKLVHRQDTGLCSNERGGGGGGGWLFRLRQTLPLRLSVGIAVGRCRGDDAAGLRVNLDALNALEWHELEQRLERDRRHRNLHSEASRPRTHNRVTRHSSA